jgi:hypothetical protein
LRGIITQKKREDNNKKGAVLVNVVIGDSMKKPRLLAGLFLTKNLSYSSWFPIQNHVTVSSR